MGAVIAREPDLVHAVVEADDAVFRHNFSYIAHDALGRRRKPRFVRPVSDTRNDFAPQPGERGVDLQLALDTVSQQCEAGADIAGDLSVREVHLLHIGRGKANMYHFRAVWTHDEGRLLNRVMAN